MRRVPLGMGVPRNLLYLDFTLALNAFLPEQGLAPSRGEKISVWRDLW